MIHSPHGHPVSWKLIHSNETLFVGKMDERSEETIQHFEERVAVERYECLELILDTNQS